MEQGGREEEGESGNRHGAFDISHKSPSIASLERWRKFVLVRNALRRFRYTANIKKRKQMLEERRQFRVGILATKAAILFLRPGNSQLPKPRVVSSDGLGLHRQALVDMLGNRDSYESLGKAEGIAEKLKVSLEHGIPDTKEDTDERVKTYGRNQYDEKPPRGFLRLLWEALHDITLLVLIVCALVSLAVGIPTEGLSEGWYDGGGILFSVFLVVFVTAGSDYRQSLQFQALEKEKRKVYIQVTRGGRRRKVLTSELLVGDVVHLSIGDIIPADGIYCSGYSLAIDESNLTGESDLIYPSPEKPFLNGGSSVKDGSGKMIVTAVGMSTQWGRLMSDLSDAGIEETPLQVKLNEVATLVGKIGVVFAGLTLVALMIRFLLSKESLSDWSLADLNQILEYFAVAVTIIVVAVPEGLPLAVTLSLAYAMNQMMKEKALVRRLSACETMGSATTICSDKTGTLTTNIMVVSKVWIAGNVWEIGVTNNAGIDISSPLRDSLLEGIFQNTSGDVDDSDNNPKFLGTPTEVAFLGFGYALRGCFREVRSKSKIVSIEPFNSDKKRMGVLIQCPENGYRAYIKGAAEIIVRSCDSILNSEGRRVALDEDYRSYLLDIIKGFSGEALRTLCLAVKELDDLPSGDSYMESGFTCVGIFGIKDPVRPGVKDAVNLCFKAGIKVRMVTGDSLETAKSIARECNILTEDRFAVEGQTFRHWTEEQMKQNIPDLQVLARSLPDDKLLLVRKLKELREVVAVTGDGTNDAPALHESDIGLSMGISGTEVAKESSDVVILDDNFSTVVSVAKWGRSVYTNIQKFVQFQLTVNLVALCINFTSACVTGIYLCRISGRWICSFHLVKSSSKLWPAEIVLILSISSGAYALSGIYIYAVLTDTQISHLVKSLSKLRPADIVLILSISIGEAPLTAVQLLWVNLIMDTLGALALATEPPYDALMEKQPVGRKANFISNVMWRNITGQAIYQFAVLMVLQYKGAEILHLSGSDSESRLNTIIFNSFVFCQVFNEVNCREMEKLNVFKHTLNNPVFLAVISGTVAFQVLMVQFLGKFASTVPLSIQEWLISVLIGFVGVFVAFFVKLIPVPSQPFLASSKHSLNKQKSDPVKERLLGNELC